MHRKCTEICRFIPGRELWGDLDRGVSGATYGLKKKGPFKQERRPDCRNTDATIANRLEPSPREGGNPGSRQRRDPGAAFQSSLVRAGQRPMECADMSALWFRSRPRIGADAIAQVQTGKRGKPALCGRRR
jgi:hypothetical protein